MWRRAAMAAVLLYAVLPLSPVANAQVTQSDDSYLRTPGTTRSDGPTDQPASSTNSSASRGTPAGSPVDLDARGYTDERTDRRESDSARGSAVDVRRRAERLSRMPVGRYGVLLPILYPTQSPDLRDQISQLGASIAQNQAGAPIRPLAQPQGRRPSSGVPPAGESRLMPDQIVVEVSSSTPPQAIAALALRNGLTLLDQFASQLTGTTMLLLRVEDQLSVAAKVRALEVDDAVLSAQPNYLFVLQDAAGLKDAAPLQYAPAKLRLAEAHQLAEGDHVLVAVIDSGVDGAHPELAGSLAGTFDATGTGARPQSHGTAVAGLIVAHAKLTGSAPKARILAVHAFDTADGGAQSTTFSILKGLDWAAAKGARVINMSFAGPPDPAMHRSLEFAFDNGIVLIAAAGNAGPKSAPLYPGADTNVVAVTATDAADRIFAASNRGNYVGLAAPGVDVLLAAPDNAYEIASGTSFSAAEISGIAALILERRPDLAPGTVRAVLLATGRALGGPAGPKLADAYQALAAVPLSDRQLRAGR